MKVAVYGAGGVGAYFGGRLLEAGVDVSFVARGAHLQAIKQRGLRVDSINGNFLVHPKIATADPAEIGAVDLVLVCVKGWQVEQAAQAMQPLVAEHSLVLPLLNGVDAVDILSAQLGREKVLNGLCGIFAKMHGPGHINHLGAAPWLQFGEQDNAVTERSKRVLTLLQCTEGFTTELVENITTAVWRKFIFIASTSGVGSVTRAPFGALRSNPATADFLKGVISEIIELAVALKVDLPADIERLVWQQIEKSGANSDTSMQRDVLAGRPSELDSQTGAVLRLADRAGVATPLNQMIYACLLPQEQAARATASSCK